MKNLILFLTLALIGLESSGQQYQPIQPYKNGYYTNMEVKKIILSGTKLSYAWSCKVLEIVNPELKITGENIRLKNEKLGLENIEWILNQTKDTVIILGWYWNSHRINNEITYFLEYDSKGTKVTMFEFGKCKIILYKDTCINLIKDYPIRSKTIQQVDPLVNNNTDNSNQNQNQLNKNNFNNNNTPNNRRCNDGGWSANTARNCSFINWNRGYSSGSIHTYY